MTMNQVPSTNPFPDNPVVENTIEGLPDYQTKSFFAASEKLDIYVEDFEVLEQKPKGMALGIRGRVGSGKTHVVFQLIGHVRSKPLTIKTIYVKAEKIDIWDIYVNHFAREFKFDDLRDLISLHLAKLLRTQSPLDRKMAVPGQRSLLELARQEVDELVKQNPQEILRLIQQDLLPVSNLQRKLNSQIEATPQGPTNDFFLAYSRLTDNDLGPLAVRWLKGEELTTSEQKDLGLVAAGIKTPNQAKDAFRFLLSAFRKADYAIMFCLDEFERFGAPGPPATIKQLAALLKDLAEIFKGTGQVLVVAGVNEAWNVLTSDVLARIQRPDIIEIKLEKGEARQLLNAYCQPRNALKDLFDEDALNMLSEASRRNARQLLTLAHHTFADALSTQSEPHSVFPITASQVEQSLTKSLGGPRRLDTVLQGIRDVAKELSLAVQQEDAAGGVRYKVSLGDANRPSEVFLVAESIFKLGEVSAATTVNEISRDLRQHSARTRICVIIVGYSTAHIRKDLEKVVDRVFLFGEDDMLDELREFIKAAPLKDFEVEQKILEQDAAYYDLLQKFDSYEQSRRGEIHQLTEALTAVQQKVAQTGEAAREKRVKDKMEETLEEIKVLLQQEDALLSSLLPPQGSIDKVSVAIACERAIWLLEDQRANVKRAFILNQKMPLAEKFTALLDEEREHVERATDSWRQIYSRSDFTDASSIPDLLRRLKQARALFTDRRRILTELELLHLQRLSFDEGSVLARLTSILGRTSWVTRIILGVFLLSLLFGYKSLSDAWSRETTVLQNHVTTLKDIESILTRTQLLEKRDDGSFSTNVLDELVRVVIALRGSESEIRSLEYTPLDKDFNQKIEEQLLDIRDSLAGFLRIKVISDDRDMQLPYNLDRKVKNSIKDCMERKTFITSVTFSRFAWRFVRLNTILISFIFLPLLTLLFWRLNKHLLYQRRFKRRL